MAGTYEQFVAFGTDLVGLERLLRLFQSACSLLIAYPLLLAAVWPNSPPVIQAAKATGLATVRGQLNVSRRFIRLFRFLDTLKAGWEPYVGVEEKSLEVWLGIISKTSLGLFGMTETMTLVDLMGIDSLQVFGPVRSKEIDAQAQYFWFVGLAASVLASIIKLNGIDASVPSEDAAKTAVAEKDGPEEDAEKETPEKSAAEAEKEKQRQRAVSAKKKVLVRGLVSDTVDMLLPGSAIGLVNITPGQVSAAMFFTTLTTGWAAWDRTGAKLQQ
ncbi:hypothetical protein AK830_g11826 [Neonectria ditissima]|uniref:AoPex11B-like protein n=1 Tax=Neonectria ditissima TaxID=78410 RepID=A0A0P7B6W0_9HYPO|nr:hypothetical protein AK830_g11826 [Neonectria ditissima]